VIPECRAPPTVHLRRAVGIREVPQVNEATYALLGVVVGALIPAVTAIYVAHRQADQAYEDRQDARDARLFDHRRAAYTSFVRVTREPLDRAWHENAGIGNPPPVVDYDFLDPIVAAESLVQMHGTPDTRSWARDVVLALRNYAHESRTDGAFKQVETFLELSTESASADLGVTKLPEHIIKPKRRRFRLPKR
jgi:hypothetical protein